MDWEKGSILLPVLVVFMIISLLFLSIMEIAIMERKMSKNCTSFLQASQALDGGIDWTCEQTYFNLQTYSSSEVLPDLVLSTADGRIDLNVPSAESSYRVLGQGVKLIDEGYDYCIYEFSCEGSCRGVIQKAKVKVRYDYTEIYCGSILIPLFNRRVFADHGRIIDYMVVNH